MSSDLYMLVAAIDYRSEPKVDPQTILNYLQNPKASNIPKAVKLVTNDPYFAKIDSSYSMCLACKKLFNGPSQTHVFAGHRRSRLHLNNVASNIAGSLN